MARETKVGLLAGLAFIICFAVILTNRGREGATTPPRPVMTDSGGRVPSNMQQSASRTPVRPPVVAPSTGSELVLLDRGMNVPPIAPTTPTSDPTERNLTSRTPDAGNVANLPQTITVPSPQLNPVPAPTSNAKSYTVAPGDTLSKIALTQYGNKSRSTVDAIFAANRSQMESPDSLKSGMMLSLPNLPTAKSPTPVEASPSLTRKATPPEPKVVQAKAPADSGSAAPRFYQVKKNDRWASIAREQLGDASRWRELHELNKDKFPDPQKIREGVRIKLPAGKPGQSPGSRS